MVGMTTLKKFAIILIRSLGQIINKTKVMINQMKKPIETWVNGDRKLICLNFNQNLPSILVANVPVSFL